MRREVVEDVRPKNRPVQIGERVVVTESGAIRLGKRELKPMTTMLAGLEQYIAAVVRSRCSECLLAIKTLAAYKSSLLK
jgi:hypothetical protein